MKWSWLRELPLTSYPIYWMKCYSDLFAAYDGSSAAYLVGEKEGRHIYLPLLICPIGNQYREAYTAYGYGGLWGQEHLREEELLELKAFLAQEGIIALFIRHAPFLANQLLWPERVRELNRWTYIVNLSPQDSFELYLTQLPQKLRWSANYAHRKGVRVVFHSLEPSLKEHLSLFYELYASLMHQKESDPYYCFSKEFFYSHIDLLGKHCEFAQVLDSTTGDFLGGALFLHDNAGWVHYYLSASNQQAMKLQAMDLLMASAIFRYGTHGFKALHLGGGHSLDESDGLSHYKAKFASTRVPFYCTKLICDTNAYEKERARLPLVNPDFFLLHDARGGVL
jgi:hypothetical protein